MYAMTAAHKTMPIPSYARVRNPANGREVIVRINDRGPFHAGRVIDLSYTAALKLGVLNARGTGRDRAHHARVDSHRRLEAGAPSLRALAAASPPACASWQAALHRRSLQRAWPSVAPAAQRESHREVPTGAITTVAIAPPSSAADATAPVASVDDEVPRPAPRPIAIGGAGLLAATGCVSRA